MNKVQIEIDLDDILYDIGEYNECVPIETTTECVKRQLKSGIIEEIKSQYLAEFKKTLFNELLSDIKCQCLHEAQTKIPELLEQALTAKQGKTLKNLIDTNNDSVVHLANSETITGTKTFTAHPVVPSKSSLPASPSSTQYATEAQVNTRYGKVANASANNILAVGSDTNLIDTGIDYTSLVETTDPRLTNARPASDVSAWAKAATKPTYTATEVGADPTGTAASAVNTHNSAENAHSELFAAKEAAGTAASAVATHNTAGDAHSTLFAGKANTSHTQAASTITAGTLAGEVKANATAVATLANAQVRNIYAGTTDLTAGTSVLATGDIYFVYE